MKTSKPEANGIDDYIAGCPEDVRPILEEIRQIIRSAAPSAKETIKYQMPTFVLHGNLVHFAAFKNHIGLFPPVTGSPVLMKRLTPYRGEKGNFRFPLDEPMPYDLIAKILKLRIKADLADFKAKSARR